MGKSCSALSASSLEYLSSVCSAHSLAEAVLLFSLKLFRLVCSKHYCHSFSLAFNDVTLYYIHILGDLSSVFFKLHAKKVDFHHFYSTINIPPHSGGYFIFGRSPNTTGCAQVRFRLACQPCIGYLLPVNGFRDVSSPPSGREVDFCEAKRRKEHAMKGIIERCPSH